MNEKQTQPEESNSANELEVINALSEEAIRQEYLSASLHGPKWILGLIKETL